MITLKNIDYVTDRKGKRKSVLLRASLFEKIKDQLEDLEDALELEKARKNATGFKKWNDFIKENNIA